MHGLGEHCARYAHVARFFNARGWSVRTYDHRGHGRSGGARGDTPNTDAIVQDAATVIADVARRSGRPPILFGHSMGGLFAARCATAGMVPLRGLILSSPALAIPLSGVHGLLLKALGAIAPGLGVPNGLQTRYLSHDPAIVSAYENDPLVHPKISARLLRGMLDAAAFAHRHASSLTLPTLMVVAGDDRLVDASGSDRFFSALRAGTGTIHRYTGYYHEVLNEVGAQRVFDDIDAWLDKHFAEAMSPDCAV
ncbi:lysophospholipase [Noviherbaspirillum saxi]|uniref:Lysophospholipase n=2 Tax=Noviherbaspirillum saxi TaxID=2320863 RepID=A0A3A3FUK2_9BURK|nr:lysophospholipase [Noviherbaspirillum saxi]